MRVGPFIVRKDAHCWIIAEPKVFEKGKREGETYEYIVCFPATFDKALRRCLELMVRRGIEPEASLADAVATVAHMYRRVGEDVRDAREA